MSAERVAQLEEFIRRQGLKVPAEEVSVLGDLKDTHTVATLPLNDVRLMSNGSLIVHPRSSNNLRLHRELIGVRRRARGGLEITVKKDQLSKLTLYVDTPDMLDEGWNVVKSIREEV